MRKLKKYATSVRHDPMLAMRDFAKIMQKKMGGSYYGYRKLTRIITREATEEEFQNFFNEKVFPGVYTLTSKDGLRDIHIRLLFDFPKWENSEPKKWKDAEFMSIDINSCDEKMIIHENSIKVRLSRIHGTTLIDYLKRWLQDGNIIPYDKIRSIN